MNYSIRDSLRTLDEVFRVLMSPTGGVDAIDPQIFAHAWEGAKSFRDLTLLVMARHCYASVYAPDEDLRLSFDTVAQRLIDFTFRYLTKRHIAYAFDLTTCIVDDERLNNAIAAYMPTSRFFTPELAHACNSGLDGSYYFDPESLLTQPESALRSVPDFSLGIPSDKVLHSAPAAGMSASQQSCIEKMAPTSVTRPTREHVETTTAGADQVLARSSPFTGFKVAENQDANDIGTLFAQTAQRLQDDFPESQT